MQSKSAPFSDVIAAHLANAEFLRNQGIAISDDTIALSVYAAFLNRSSEVLMLEDIRPMFQVVLKPIKQRLKNLWESILAPQYASLEEVFATGRSPTTVLRALLNIDELGQAR